MNIAVMQPYIFPYIGYLQMVNAVDVFVQLDDVQFIKRGWINRNRILNQNADLPFSIPLVKAPQSTLIMDRQISPDWQVQRGKLIKLLARSYGKAPAYADAMALIEKVLLNDEANLAAYIDYSLRLLCEYLSVETRIIKSSELGISTELKGQDRILNICEHMKATHYTNASGGQELYDRPAFEAKGISLSFIKTGDVRYEQFGKPFVPNLSIIDVLMFNRPDEIRDQLAVYELI